MQLTNIRNFCIVAHVDHGKSTLADRFLEIAGTVQKGKHEEQFLDQNPISRERGITIKLAPVRMMYELEGKAYMLNLIDTPGHMDFSYEVSRTLAACEGAILLVDATKGIQAQTVAHFNEAKKENLTIVPVINKIDLETARVSEVAKSMEELFHFQKEEILYISAKTGENVSEVLKKVIEKIPPPKSQGEILKSLVFDAFYDEHKGAISFVRVFDGLVRRGDKILFTQSGAETEVLEVGYFSPFLVSKDGLLEGEIGYIVTGIKDIRKTRVGDTITSKDGKVLPLPGYQTPKPMVFFGMYPKNPGDFPLLRTSLTKLSLNDSSLSIAPEHSAYLGNGFRVGFLGLLHADIIRQRLAEEEKIEPLLTTPRVLYQEEGDQLFEPYMLLSIFVPNTWVGAVMSSCQRKKGNLKEMSYYQGGAVLKYEMPYSMFIRGLYTELKSVSSGFASIDYELIDYRKADLVNLEVLINQYPVDILSELVYKDEASSKARKKAEDLKNILTRQQFRQVIQVTVGGTILAREEIPPFRKDVLAKLSGGDRTRKDKLLEKQKKGKSKLVRVSKVDIPQKAFIESFSLESK